MYRRPTDRQPADGGLQPNRADQKGRRATARRSGTGDAIGTQGGRLGLEDV